MNFKGPFLRERPFLQFVLLSNESRFVGLGHRITPASTVVGRVEPTARIRATAMRDGSFNIATDSCHVVRKLLCANIGAHSHHTTPDVNANGGRDYCTFGSDNASYGSAFT